MENIINLKMLSHPINWLLVWVVILVAAFAFKEIHQGISSGGTSDIPD